jgi:hypothetical protein
MQQAVNMLENRMNRLEEYSNKILPIEIQVKDQGSTIDKINKNFDDFKKDLTEWKTNQEKIIESSKKWFVRTYVIAITGFIVTGSGIFFYVNDKIFAIKESVGAVSNSLVRVDIMVSSMYDKISEPKIETDTIKRTLNIRKGKK